MVRSLVLLMLCFPMISWGKVLKVRGEVFVEGQSLPLRKGDKVDAGATVFSESSQGYVKLRTGRITFVLRGKFKSKLVSSSEGRSAGELLYGKMRVTSKGQRFRVKTPSAVAGVRGTDFSISFLPLLGETEVICFESEISFGDLKKQNTVKVSAGQWGGHGGRFGGVKPPVSLPKNVLDHFRSEFE